MQAFVEKLKEHNHYCDCLMGRAQAFMLQAQESNDLQESEELISRAEEFLGLVNTVSERFDTEHEGELSTLAAYLLRKKNEVGNG